MKIKSLNCPALLEADISNLNRVNIHTTEQIVTYADLDKLSRLTKVPITKLKILKKFINGHYSPYPQHANEILSKYVRNLSIIKFGCERLDTLVSKGVYSGELTEITGASGMGKTQLCLNLISNMFVTYPAHNCLYIDSNKNFCIRRIKALIKSENSLKSIKIIDCKNIYHLMDILCSIRKSSSLQPGVTCPNLLIIDNLSVLLNTFRTSNTNNLEISFHINTVVTYLNYLTRNMNMTVVMTTNFNTDSLSIYNESWKRFSNLEILVRRLNSVERSSLNPVSEDSEKLRVFEVLKCNRPFIENNTTRTSNFRFSDNGLE